MFQRKVGETMMTLAVCAMAGMLLMPMDSQANNHEDTIFEFDYGTATASGYAAGGRLKTDDSSSYMYCVTVTATTPYDNPSGGAYKALVHGSKTQNGSYSNMKTSSGYGVNGSTSYPLVYSRVYQEYKVYRFVESGQRISVLER